MLVSAHVNIGVGPRIVVKGQNVSSKMKTIHGQRGCGLRMRGEGIRHTLLKSRGRVVVAQAVKPVVGSLKHIDGKPQIEQILDGTVWLLHHHCKELGAWKTSILLSLATKPRKKIPKGRRCKQTSRVEIWDSERWQWQRKDIGKGQLLGELTWDWVFSQFQEGDKLMMGRSGKDLDQRGSATNMET